VSIRIETAGGAADNSENATTTVSRRWFIPVLPESLVDEIIAEIRSGIDLDTDGYDWIPLAKRAKSRFIRIACVMSCVLVAAVYLTFGWKWASAALLAFPVLVLYAIRKSQSVKYARTDFGVVYRSGVLAKKTSFSFFEKIQAASWRQTPFDRRWQMATLSVDTAAAGPAEHVIDIKYLDQKIAKDEYKQIVALAAEK
jgi:putative membrane protein